MRLPIRAAAIVLKDNQLLVMHRIKNGEEYYVFPGGGVEDTETIEQTVVREVSEEMSIKVKVNRLLYHHHLVGGENDSDQYFYLCDYIAGEPKLGNANELTDMQNKIQFYDPIWFPVEKLKEILLYPVEIRDWLIADLKSGFADKVKEATINLKDLRRTI